MVVARMRIRRNKFNMGHPMGIPIVVGAPLNTQSPPPGATSAEVTAAQIASKGSTTATATSAETTTTSGPFITASTYISNVGDEPPAGTSVLDLSQFLSGSLFTNLNYFLTYLPRSMFTPWFNQTVIPSIVAPAPIMHKLGVNSNAIVTLQDAQNMVKASFLSLFNSVNMQYANSQQIDPWAWEELKTEAYYQNLAQPQESTMFQNIASNIDPQAITIAQAYQNLTPLGDPGLELRRQNAILWLLNNKYYSDAQNVINQFQNLSNVQYAIISVPIPMTVPIPASASSSGAAETLMPTNNLTAAVAAST